MRDSVRFTSPLSTSRPPGAHLIEAFSLKLGRRLRCFSRHAFDQWIRLEADPSVLALCERPLSMQFASRQVVADYWVRSKDSEYFVVIDAQDHPSEVTIGDTTLAVRQVPLAELAAARVWISNWEQMLPPLVACRELITRALANAIAQFVCEPMPLSRIERHFVSGDPTLVRATVFSLLHSGRLRAPTLATQSLSLLSVFEPTESIA